MISSKFPSTSCYTKRNTNKKIKKKKGNTKAKKKFNHKFYKQTQQI